LRYEIVSVPEQERRVPLPYISTGETLLGAFFAPGTPKNFSASNAREIGDIRGGAVQLPDDLGAGAARVALFHRRTHGHDGEARSGLAPKVSC